MGILFVAIIGTPPLVDVDGLEYADATSIEYSLYPSERVQFRSPPTSTRKLNTVIRSAKTWISGQVTGIGFEGVRRISAYASALKNAAFAGPHWEILTCPFEGLS